MAKFCLKYFPFCGNYIDKADELLIKYNPNDRTLPEFVEKYQDKTIIINVNPQLPINPDEEGFTGLDKNNVIILSELSKKYKNIKIIFNSSDKVAYSLAIENNIPFFFSNRVGTLDEMHGLMKYHPTDMYICEELGFSLYNIARILHEQGIRIRVFPNICQSSFTETPSLYTFFIRPDDIRIYTPIVDVFELITDKDRQQVIFKIYKEGKWFGKLNEIIPSFHGELDNKYILDGFGLFRCKCDKRCYRKPSSCGICAKYVAAADALEEKGIMITHEPNKF